jgi:serine/threonine-protein kinase
MAATDTTASKWIWPFELKDKLGEGGMGVVYRARYVGNNRMVAVKLLPDSVADNPTIVSRFERELEILQQLKHPHIVNCFGGVCESQQRFYAMELVEGGTLADLLHKRGRLSWDHVVEFGLQMCEALQYAHERGVIHRDVKPGNFLLTKSGQLKLSDFGLATMVAASRLTSAGKTAGTFQYMAPEQIRGKPPISNRTDLYALGCVLFELLTGRPPFEGDSPAEMLHKHLKDPIPRPSAVVLDCPPALDQLIVELLAKDPEQRVASAAEVGGRLKAILRPSLTHIDPLARTPLASVASVVASKEGDSAAELSHRRDTMLVLAIAGWWQVWSQAARWSALERQWITAATQGSDYAIQRDGVERLKHLPMWSSQVAPEVSKLLDSPEPRLRQAALEAFERHPTPSKPFVAEVRRVLAKDETDFVRQQAQATERALMEAPGRWSATGAVLGLMILAGLGGVGWWGWRLAQSSTSGR